MNDRTSTGRLDIEVEAALRKWWGAGPTYQMDYEREHQREFSAFRDAFVLGREAGAAEAARLRAALQAIAEGSWNFGNRQPGFKVYEYARAVLSAAEVEQGEGKDG